MWNWSKSPLCDDALFIASCINSALGNEIQWPTVEERVSLGTHLWEFPGCIGFIDDTLIEICKPWQNEAHHVWFSEPKNKMQ
jgi:hypothetical protein